MHVHILILQNIPLRPALFRVLEQLLQIKILVYNMVIGRRLICSSEPQNYSKTRGLLSHEALFTRYPRALKNVHEHHLPWMIACSSRLKLYPSTNDKTRNLQHTQSIGVTVRDLEQCSSPGIIYKLQAYKSLLPSTWAEFSYVFSLWPECMSLHACVRLNSSGCTAPSPVKNHCHNCVLRLPGPKVSECRASGLDY
jgi:hypothetical protein